MTRSIFSLNRIVRLLLVTVCMVALTSLDSAHAQNDTDAPPIYRIATPGGAVHIGTLVSEDDEAVVLATEDGTEVRITRPNISEMTQVHPNRIHNGTYWFENPQATRYFFAPSAIGLRDGHGYYQNAWVFFNNVNYGISDRFSIGGGTVPTFLFGAGEFPFWVLPKLSFANADENLHLAFGAVLGGVVGGGDSGSVGLLYSSGTLGGRDHNVTTGIGYGYANGTLADTPFFNVSGMTRLSRRFHLVSENYFFSAGDDLHGVISFGMRYAPENFAVDFGLFRPLADTGSFIAAPWLGVSIPFGR